uniref:E3 ubiquitin-protein ligase n=1 Tax=Gongylonema pulchrum TaxID=637853 RepID=A0A183D539_9BILA
LLKYGANPDLRDEEGKTALDKANEKSEEGHQEVARILESPSVYMQKSVEGGTENDGVKDSTSAERVGEAVIRQLLEQLLPVLCDVYQRSLCASVQKSSLSLLRKTIRHISSEALEILVSNDDEEDIMTDSSSCCGQRLAENLVGVLMAGFEHENDIDIQDNVLQVTVLIREASIY